MQYYNHLSSLFLSKSHFQWSLSEWLIVTAALLFLMWILLSIFHRKKGDATCCPTESDIELEYLDENDIIEEQKPLTYIISKPSCASTNSTPALLIIIFSEPSHYEERNAIRETWFMSNNHMLSYFLIGKTESTDLQEQIESENQQFNDIIQGEFVDNWFDKQLIFFQWTLTECAGAEYMIQVNDDMFVNMAAVCTYLLKENTEIADVFGVFIPEDENERRQTQLSNEIYSNYMQSNAIIYTKHFIESSYASMEKWFLSRSEENIGLIGIEADMIAIDISNSTFTEANVTRLLEDDQIHILHDYLFVGPEISTQELDALWQRVETQLEHLIEDHF